MFARATTTQMKAEKLDEAIALFRDSVMPEARKQKGFKGGHLLVDRETGRGVAVTVWDTEAAARQTGEESPYLQTQLAKFGSMFAAPPVVEYFELAVLEM